LSDKGGVEFTIPGAIPSAANLWENWRARHGRTKRQRYQAHIVARGHVGFDHGTDLLAQGGVVTLTRVSPRPLDSDNLASSLKAIRDGIADTLGINDGDPRVTWAYEQAKCRKGEQGVRVRVEVNRRAEV
jgi:hypothetical protein